ncbi:MAG: class II aldolase/adducin family protein [Oscillospiraceae bacterium]|nr:class II aldolase/adducin family protein [Oscillospiraceae bacterium]
MTIIDICKEMHHRNWGAKNGNVSKRIDDRTFSVTPSKIAKNDVTDKNLVIVDLSGTPLGKCKNPTSELKMHLQIYTCRPDVNAIVHAHPPYATAFAVTGKSIDSSNLVEMSLTIGDVPVAPFAEQGSDAVGESLVPFLKAGHDVILLKNHGAIAVGDNLTSAFEKLDTLELCSKTLLYAKLLK